TRNYVERLKIALASGELIDLRRGEFRADKSGRIALPLPGRIIEAQLPSYRMPRVRKHAAGYYVAPEMDLLDLFIGSEGTLGVMGEIEVRLLPTPAGLLSGVIFFESEDDLLAFVREARMRSLTNREIGRAHDVATSDKVSAGPDARALEYFDRESLRFLRQKYETVPERATGAIFFEQETTPSAADWLNEGVV